MEKESWISKISKDCIEMDVIYPFLEHISGIGIESRHIKGKILIIGQGFACPERSLITTPESQYRQIRSGINPYFCDPDFPSSPNLHIKNPCLNTIMYNEIPTPKPDFVYYEPSSCYEFLPKVPKNYFDCVLMFRVVDLGKQLTNMQLMRLIANYLKSGGYFIGSGGQFSSDVKTMIFDPLAQDKIVRLNDDSDGYLFTQNMGFILKK